jgi:hypothetical protein
MKPFIFIIVCMICLDAGGNVINTSGISAISDSPESRAKDHRVGYEDIVFFQGRYIAVGTGGRIDCVTLSGETIPLDTSCRYDLHCAYAGDEILIVAGEGGKILYSRDGENYYPAVSETDVNIRTIACKNGVFIAGADSGIILWSMDGLSWKKIRTNIRGTVVSLSANSSFFIGVTDAGEIIKSGDGKKWDVKEYNKEYAGYNPYTNFSRILASPNSILIIGMHVDGSPSILYSTLGNVWTEREPIYQDEQGVFRSLSSRPNGIAYDADRDQFAVACDNGEILILPPCAKCNKWAKISETNYEAIICRDHTFLIVGEEFSVLIQRVF